MVHIPAVSVWRIRSSFRGNAVDVSSGHPASSSLVRLAISNAELNEECRLRLCRSSLGEWLWRRGRLLNRLTKIHTEKELATAMPNPRPIRRAQLISPFGIGALVNFRGDESLMTAGLDEWPFATDECPSDWLVREERLQTRLNKTHFRLPPEFREPGQGVQHPNQFIPFVRFPRWHYCPRVNTASLCPHFIGIRCPLNNGMSVG